ncbi:aromatic prenyltransferase [Streptomyces sp. NBC_00258]|uniref:aromatic prenyltransferase n=1 Tax=Streptomyces sp. NBC_00258 TaxID=2903642 RepID=UPI002E2B6A83|nr:aromatic prenyltransferase [Streptomyces sp. NBC_00258]
MNRYCDRATTELLDPDHVQSMLREMGLRQAGEQGLEFTKKTIAIYPTLNWDSSKIVRICVAVITNDPATALTASEYEAGQMREYATAASHAYVVERRALVYL